MSARDELARTIQFAKELADPDWSLSVPHVAKQAIARLVEIIEAEPRTVTTPEELDGLAEGSAVLDADSDVSTKHNGMWHGYEMNPLNSRKFAKCGPFTVLHEPKTA